MLWTIIKNNFKLMFRNKIVVIMMTLCPILVVAALSSAFQTLLKTDYDEEGFTIGYYAEEKSEIALYLQTGKEEFEKNDIIIKEFAKVTPEYLVKDETVDIFVHVKENEIVIYSSESDSMYVKICENILQQFIVGMENYKLQLIDKAQGKTETAHVSIKVTKLEGIKLASAEDYYGIIETIYFIWCGMILLAAVVQSERKNYIQRRILVSPSSRLTLYLGKFIPCELLLLVVTSISVCISTYLFDIHWGNLPGTIGILLLTSLASTAFGILCIYIVNNLAVSVVLLFAIVWFAGFIGGSFQTYMFDNFPEFINRLSPLYYVNRTIVEYSTMGKSIFTTDCIIVMSIMFVVCVALGILCMNRRMEER